MTQDDFNEALLDVTGGPQWDVVKKGLANDIYAAQAQALDAKSWEEVCELRGFAKGLAFVMNLRENLIAANKQGANLEAVGKDAYL